MSAGNQRLQARVGMITEHCLLLIRAPSDRAIYDAFRSLAARGRSRLTEEHLFIEGDIPLTAGLSSPSVPGTLERLLEADCEMIDKLELKFGSLQISYLRSGGHAPYRESFFDEIRLEADAAQLDQSELSGLLEVIFRQLSVTSYSASALLSTVVAQVGGDDRDGSRHRAHDPAPHTPRLS
jgi:hypothetical protein